MLGLGEPDASEDGLPVVLPVAVSAPFCSSFLAFSAAAASDLSMASLVWQTFAWCSSSFAVLRASARSLAAIVAVTYLRWFCGRYLSSIPGRSSWTFDRLTQASFCSMPW